MPKKKSPAALRKEKERTNKKEYGLVRKELWTTEGYWPNIKCVVEPLTQKMLMEKALVELSQQQINLMGMEEEKVMKSNHLIALQTLFELGQMPEFGFGEEVKTILKDLNVTGINLLDESTEKPVSEYRKLYKKIEQWLKREDPPLSTNEAVIVYFCTGQIPQAIEGMEPYQMLRSLNPWDLTFIVEEYEGNKVGNYE